MAPVWRPNNPIGRFLAGLIAATLAIVVLLAIRLLPRALFGPAASLLSSLYALLARRERRICLANIARAYNLPAHSSFARLFWRQCAHHQVISTLETLRVVMQPAAIHWENLEALRQKIAEHSTSHGVILFTAHLGSWELGALSCRLTVPQRLHVLAKPSKNVGVTWLLHWLRERIGLVVIWTDRPDLKDAMRLVLTTGDALGFVMDQRPRQGKGAVVPFFGMETPFVTGPAASALQAGCASLGVFAIRLGPFHYRLVTRPVEVPSADTPDRIHALTAAMAREIEATIRLWPEQWTWNYKRWPLSD